jgi:hypothetical protein
VLKTNQSSAKESLLLFTLCAYTLPACKAKEAQGHNFYSINNPERGRKFRKIYKTKTSKVHYVSG